jgi:serine/threonine protein kinase
MLSEHPSLARFLTEILGKRLEDSGGIEQVGKYRLLGKIGEGATSKVYRAVHPGLNRTAAIKMLGHELVYDRKFWPTRTGTASSTATSSPQTSPSTKTAS